MNLTWKHSESYLSSFWKSWSCLNILITASENGLESPNFRQNTDRNVQLKFSQRSDCWSANIQTLIFHEGHFKNMKNNRKLKLNSCCLNMCSQGNMLCWYDLVYEIYYVNPVCIFACWNDFFFDSCYAMFLWWVAAHRHFFQIKAFEIRMDTFLQFCFDITNVSSRLPSLSQPSFCVGLLQQRFSDILNNK